MKFLGVVKIPNGATSIGDTTPVPADGVGAIIYSTVVNTLLVWNGSTWQAALVLSSTNPLVAAYTPTSGTSNIVARQDHVHPLQFSPLVATTALSSASGVVTVNLALSTGLYVLTLTENITSWTFNNLPSTGYVADIRIKIIQNASTAYTCVSPATSGLTAGGAWVVSSTLSAVESLGISVDTSGNKTVYPSGVFA